MKCFIIVFMVYLNKWDFVLSPIHIGFHKMFIKPIQKYLCHYYYATRWKRFWLLQYVFLWESFEFQFMDPQQFSSFNINQLKKRPKTL